MNYQKFLKAVAIDDTLTELEAIEKGLDKLVNSEGLTIEINGYSDGQRFGVDIQDQELNEKIIENLMVLVQMNIEIQRNEFTSL